jgi:hypothetical protein
MFRTGRVQLPPPFFCRAFESSLKRDSSPSGSGLVSCYLPSTCWGMTSPNRDIRTTGHPAPRSIIIEVTRHRRFVAPAVIVMPHYGRRRRRAFLSSLRSRPKTKKKKYNRPIREIVVKYSGRDRVSVVPTT